MAHQASSLKWGELLSPRGREVSPSVGCGERDGREEERARSSREQGIGRESLLAMRGTGSS